MLDVQMQAANIAVAIDHVGVKNLRMPIVVKDKDFGVQNTVANIEIGVDLPAEYKGTHMSRFVEAIDDWAEKSNESLDYASLKRLLLDLKSRLNAYKALASFEFPYFIRKAAPVSKIYGHMAYDCKLTGEFTSKLQIILEIKIPVMTLCPCSKAISENGAHSQRAVVHLKLKMKSFRFLEDFIDLVEQSASSQLYSILKREDEKFVTEYAYNNPCFVEDVVRNIANKLAEVQELEEYSVEVESFESIHSHNAVAKITRII